MVLTYEFSTKHMIPNRFIKHRSIHYGYRTKIMCKLLLKYYRTVKV